jgi:hypothetical protein
MLWNDDYDTPFADAAATICCAKSRFDVEPTMSQGPCAQRKSLFEAVALASLHVVHLEDGSHGVWQILLAAVDDDTGCNCCPVSTEQ